MCVVTLVAHMKCVWGKLFLAVTILPETLSSQSVCWGAFMGQEKNDQITVVSCNLLTPGCGGVLSCVLVCQDGQFCFS